MLQNPKQKRLWTKKLRPITESSLSRILGTHYEHGYVTISLRRTKLLSKSAHRHYYDSDVDILTFNQLRLDVKEAGFGYIPVIGSYQEKGANKPDREVGLLIPAKGNDWDKLFKLAKKLCKKYDQDTFLGKPPENIDVWAYLFDRNGNAKLTFTGKTVNNIKRQYYTFLNKHRNPLHDPIERMPDSKESDQFALMEFYVFEAASSYPDFVMRHNEGEIVLSEDVVLDGR